MSIDPSDQSEGRSVMSRRDVLLASAVGTAIAALPCKRRCDERNRQRDFPDLSSTRIRNHEHHHH